MTAKVRKSVVALWGAICYLFRLDGRGVGWDIALCVIGLFAFFFQSFLLFLYLHAQSIADVLRVLVVRLRRQKTEESTVGIG